MWNRFKALLVRPVDGGSLAAFRIVLGLVLALEAYSLLRPRVVTNWVRMFYTGPDVHWNVPFPGFAWLRPLPDPFMTLVCVLLGLAGLMVALGAVYRLSATVMFCTWTYIFLIDAVQYNNHYYLMVLLAFLMIWMPAERCFSIDRRRAKSTAGSRPSWWGLPTLRTPALATNESDYCSGDVPFWCVFLLRAQWTIVYFYAGLAKVNPEWLVAGEPIGTALASAQLPSWLEVVFGTGAVAALSAWLQSRAVVMSAAYASMLFDLLAAPLLLWRRTRILGALLAVLFHGANHFLLFEDIGWFPLLALGGTTIFFEPDWPRRLARLWSGRPRPSALAAPATSMDGRRTVAVLVLTWLTIQCVVPLRHFFIAGDASWTGEADRFSWRMKVTSLRTGPLRIRLEDPELIHLDDEDRLQVNDRLWDAPRVVYRDIDARTLDWSRLGEIVVVLQPLWGERIVFNPLSGRAGDPLSPAAARERIRELWRSAYGREPHVYDALPLIDVLETLDHQLDEHVVAQNVRQLLSASRAAAEKFASRAISQDEFDRAYVTLYRSLLSLFRDRRHEGGKFGRYVRVLLSRVQPFSLEGARQPASQFLAIEDPRLVSVGEGKLSTVNRQAVGQAWDGAELVYVDFECLTPIEWQALPRELLCHDRQGSAGVLWNQHVDLQSFVRDRVGKRPYLLYAYAQRAADAWEAEHGRHPQVFMRAYAGLNLHPQQLLLDPHVDLAAAGMKYFSHNAWILPLKRPVRWLPWRGAERRGDIQTAIDRGVQWLLRDRSASASEIWAIAQFLGHQDHGNLSEWSARWIERHREDRMIRLVDSMAPLTLLPEELGRGALRYIQCIESVAGRPRSRAVAHVSAFLSTEESGYILTHQFLTLPMAEVTALTLPPDVIGRKTDLLTRIAAEQGQEFDCSDLFVERTAILLEYGDCDRREADRWIDVLLSAQREDGSWNDPSISQNSYDGQAFEGRHHPTHTTCLAIWALAAYLDRFH